MTTASEQLPLFDDCASYEALLAARLDGTIGPAATQLLVRHLASCAACRVVADTLAPVGDAEGDHASLPMVDPTSYALGLEVARGGMGRILAARDLRIGRAVAVKELLGRSRGLAARFEREARVTARLQHPGIVPIYEIGRWPDGTPFYSMRMVEGRTLREAIAGAPTLAARLGLLPAVIAATEAVAFAHAQRVIHRDLTPSNVLVGAYGETVVIDWGLAKDLADASDVDERREREPSDGITNAGTVIGTLAYMPPEQAQGERVGERADVYALGAILYHLLAGRAPYAGSDDLLADVKAGPPRPIDRVAPSAPPDLVSIVAKAMARDPAARYPSARELADELTRFQAGRMVEAHAYTKLQRLRRFVQRNRAAVTITALAFVIVATLGTVSVRRILRESKAANDMVTVFLEERGLAELVAGNPLRALAYLTAAYERGDDSPGERFMLADAMREIDSIKATLDCGDDVRFLDVSPDGVHFAAACRDVAMIGNLTTQQWDRALVRIPGGYDEVRYSHDGALLVSQGTDGYARVFEAATGTLRATLLHAKDTRITRANFTPDDKQLVTTGFDGTAQVWDLASGQRLRTLAAGQLGFAGVHGALTPDGKTLITVTLGGRAGGWDIATGKKIGELDHGGQILGGDLSPDGKLGCTAGLDHVVKVWDIEQRTLRFTLQGHTDAVWKCVFDPTSKRLVTAGNDGNAKVWDLATGTLISSVEAGDIVWWVTWSADGQRIATNSLGGALKVWAADSGALLSSHDDPFGGRASRFSRDGKWLITQRADGRVRIWSEPGGALRRDVALATRPAAVTPDGTRAVITEGFHGPELWDATTDTRIAHEEIAEPFALSGDGTVMVGNAGDAVVVIDARTGATRARIAMHAPTRIALDHRGHRLVAISGGIARGWDLATRRPVPELGPADELLLARDGQRAVLWTAGKTSLWDVDAGRELASLPQTDTFSPVGFSADHTRVALHVGTPEERALAIYDERGALIASERVRHEAARLDPGAQLVAVTRPDNVVKVVRLADGATLAHFIAEKLGRIQVDASGELIAAIDNRGAALLVLAARNGAVLARHEILHGPPTPTDSTFTLPDAAAWWTGEGDDRAIVTVSQSIAVWDAHSETRSPDAIVKLARPHLPWHVKGGKLEPIAGEIHGRVTHDGLAPGRPVKVMVGIRMAALLPTNLSWAIGPNTTRVVFVEKTILTGSDGTFSVKDMVPGEYTLVARSAELHLRSRPLDVHVSDLEDGVELELAPDEGSASAPPAWPAP